MINQANIETDKPQLEVRMEADGKVIFSIALAFADKSRIAPFPYRSSQR
ncbi:MAG: hypothetical protein ACU83V_08635 [Gammaproteobacteria bacterium]